MADRTSFTAEEWDQIRGSVMLAAIAVTAAEPSGLWGLLQESFASGSALAQAKADSGANPLVKAVIADFETAEGRSGARDALRAKFAGRNPQEAKSAAVEGLRQVAALLNAKAAADAPAFKEWLRQVSQRVAEAAKEGGFLGFGGVPVSEAEKATLAEISQALRLTA
jgi:hypothetical protein